jgi:hypothetical protein
MWPKIFFFIQTEEALRSNAYFPSHVAIECSALEIPPNSFEGIRNEIISVSA